MMDVVRVMGARLRLVLLGALGVALLTWLWSKTRIIDPSDHAQIDSALRELRSLDRTINQDVLRARYQLIDGYHPVLKSYRRIEELEAVIAVAPRYLDLAGRNELSSAVEQYRAAVTRKQTSIEAFKYRSAELRELLSYLPAAGTGVASAAAAAAERELSEGVTSVLQQMLVYNLSSDESLVQRLRGELDALKQAGDASPEPNVRRRVRTFVLNCERLLAIKPEVDRLLRLIFDEPVTAHEEIVASTYARGYAAAAILANRYRIGMYAVSVALFALVAFGVRRLQQTAAALRTSNELLEERVAARTRELNSRNAELQTVLDNVDQALVTIDIDGRVARERSVALDRWFPEATPGTYLWDAMGLKDRQAAEWLRIGWQELGEGVMPEELVLAQLPKRVLVDGRDYAMQYRPVLGARGLEKVLLVASDVTDSIRRARREAEQQDQLAMFQHVMADPLGFSEFFGEASRLVEGSQSSDPGAALRALHTLKGNASLYGLELLAASCHDLETRLVETGHGLGAADKRSLTEAWSSFTERYHALTQSAERADRIELTQGELRTLRQAVQSDRSSAELLAVLRHLEREPVERRLARLSEQARSIAQRLGKPGVVVKTQSNGARLDPRRWAGFWAAFVHMLRNAIDHGIEPQEERAARGKVGAGEILIRIEQANGQVVVEISDDGRGVDWDEIRTCAKRAGLVASTPAELTALLFRGGISTKADVLETSGRGAGVSACHAACLALGGALSVSSTPGRGATFRYVIPDDEAFERALAGAA
jgi:signal transduction histidine kinase